MAIDYDIYIANEIHSSGIFQIVEDSLGLAHCPDPEFRSQHNPSLVGRGGPGFILTAHAMRSRSAEIMEEWLGFRPTVSVGFRMSKREEDWPSAYHRVLSATSAVLANVPGDVALTVNGETGLLIRRAGRVVVSNQPGVFSAEDLAEIRVPFEFGRVPTAADAP